MLIKDKGCDEKKGNARQSGDMKSVYISNGKRELELTGLTSTFIFGK